MRKIVLVLYFGLCALVIEAQNSEQLKPRLLISTDIGGTDPDDNQSMIHFFMYSNLFQVEGLISSPSYGEGSKQEIFRMIHIYEKDYHKLHKYKADFPSPNYLRSITKQGRRGRMPYVGYSSSTEGSEWIVQCAQKESNRPLWVLVWGGLDDLAQALYDAPEIATKIKVYWIGGPNKKWSANSYAYIVSHVPQLWFIENNSSYYGFFSNQNELDSIQSYFSDKDFFLGAGNLGADFKNYYKGEIKMGDTPSLLYLMHGEPDNPLSDSWGGSFTKINHSSRYVFTSVTSITDTVASCSVIEFRLQGPVLNIPSDSICFQMEVPFKDSVQYFPGYYIGKGVYSVRYVPKKAETLSYRFVSGFKELNAKGAFVVSNLWPGEKKSSDYVLGNNWYSDKPDKDLYFGKIQGGFTIYKWREAVLSDWKTRLDWLRE